MFTFRSSDITAQVFVEDETTRDVICATSKVTEVKAATRLQDGRIEVNAIDCGVEQLRDALRAAGFKISENQASGIPLVTIDKIESRNA